MVCMIKNAIIFSDGSSRGNPGPGGWGSIVLFDGKVTELGGREEHTTNNRMELLGAINGLSLLGGSTSKWQKIVPLLKERAHTFSEARAMLSGELACLFSEPMLERAILAQKEPTDRLGMTKQALESLLEPLKSLPEGLSADAVKETLMPLADEEETRGKGGRGATLWPLRYALSGAERSPDPFTLVSILGPAESASRVQKAIAIL